MSKLTTFVAGAGFGAAAAYFLDQQSGNQRRKTVADKAGRFSREGAGTVQSVAQSAGAQAKGVAAKAQQKATGGDSAPGDDNTLKSKVETEIFRDADAPKGSVDITVVEGVVEGRGQVDEQAAAEALEMKTRMVSGVRDVRNMLHLPGETAPNIVGTPGASGSYPLRLAKRSPAQPRSAAPRAQCTGAVDRFRPATSKTQKSRSITGPDTL